MWKQSDWVFVQKGIKFRNKCLLLGALENCVHKTVYNLLSPRQQFVWHLQSFPITICLHTMVYSSSQLSQPPDYPADILTMRVEGKLITESNKVRNIFFIYINFLSSFSFFLKNFVDKAWSQVIKRVSYSNYPCFMVFL